MDFLTHTLQNSPLGSHWNRIGIRHHKGIDVLLSSVHSKQSSGIGEFFDLLPLIDWCASLGLDIIQLLPLNDSGLDPSPYNTLSSCALHPVYLSLHCLPGVDTHTDLLEEIEKIRVLNRFIKTPFQEVYVQKMAFLKTYVKKEKDKLFALPGFMDFIEENPWVRPYSLFKVLKEKNNDTHFCFWPNEYLNLSNEQADKLIQEYTQECSFYMFLQYLCFTQLKHVKEKAVEKNIFLKGDLPILISPDSADLWYEPQFFDMQFSIGVPPDMYNSNGQYWGFPKPLWNVMREDGFAWWKTRLRYASNFYDIYRIDHAVGLFRLWEIQTGRPSSEGAYNPGDKKAWEALGRELLMVLIRSSSMLPIAEDLGTVPERVKEILEEMGICGTKVMRWEKTNDGSFIKPSSYPPISLTCVSTHDSTTLGGWWSDEPLEGRVYAKEQDWDYILPLPYEHRKRILRSSLRSNSLFHINLLQEYLALIPELVHPDPKEERINLPGSFSSANWTYKFTKTIEDIVSHPLLYKEMEDLLRD